MQRASSRAVCCTGDALRNRSVERGHGGGGVGGRWSVVGCGRATKYCTDGRDRAGTPVRSGICCQSSILAWPLAAVPGSPAPQPWLGFLRGGRWLRGVVGTRFCLHHRRPPPVSAAHLSTVDSDSPFPLLFLIRVPVCSSAASLPSAASARPPRRRASRTTAPCWIHQATVEP